MQALPLFPRQDELPALMGVALAWALRQSDSARARDLAQRALQQQPDEAARAQLVLGEVACLMQDQAGAERHLALARMAPQDSALAADVAWLAALIALEQGDDQAARLALQESMAHARRGGDAERLALARLQLARVEVFRAGAAPEPDWLAELIVRAQAGTAQPAALEPGLEAALLDLRGLQLATRGDFPEAIAALTRACELALASGQQRRAIGLACNLGVAYTRLGDFETALDWLRQGLDLARQCGWPGAIALCLTQSGDTLRRMGQIAQARAQLQECLQLGQARPRARSTLLALKYLAQTDLEDGRPEAALAGLQTLMQRASADDVPDLQVDAGLGQARAHLALGQREAARAAAEAALALVRRQGDPEPEIEILATLGRIAAPAPEALDYLQQALRLAEGLAGYAPSADLLDEAAALAAELQQWPQAYGWAQRASALRQQRFGEETSRRAAALQVRHQIERARAESEHLRRLAEAEAERAAALQQAHDTLLHLSAVGQEITAQLESQRVFESLSRHVQAMLDARSLAIYVLGDSGEQLLCAYGVEDGQRFEDPPLPMDEASSYCVRCVRERREIVLQGAEMVDPQAQVPGTSQMASLMFAPLALSDRVLGVMTIQSPQPQAYGERERLVLRSLCAYGAIALDNARAYQRLGALQRHVLAQEKLAALGAMVAGVAHELNTPIGNSLLVASTLLSSAREFEAQLSAGTLRRSQWETYAQRQREGLAVVERCMDSAAALVRSFKQVAVDRSAESRRRFDLAELAQQCAQTLGLALRRAGIEVELMLPPGLMMDSYPGTLSQVLVILLNNALVHAFSVRVEGARVQLGAQALDAQHLRLWVQDNGLGMASQVLERVFEPFFTTRFGQGGSGLGLSIAHNLVESLLGGRISASSEPGRGSRFVLELPLRAPD